VVSVAVQIEPQFGFDFEQITAVAEAAEAAELDGLWVSDHLVWDEEHVDRNCFEAWTLLAALTQVTDTLRLGTLVSCTSYRSPALLAKMVAGLDRISGGRIDLGIGAGWREEEYRAYGYEFPPIGVRQDQLSEAIDVIRLLWTETHADYVGEHFSLQRAVGAPKPVQSPMPIWVGGSGDRLLHIAAEKASGWNMVFGSTLDELRERHAVLGRHCEALGRDPADVARSIFLFSAVVDSESDVDALVAEESEKLGPGAAFHVDACREAGLVGTADRVTEVIRAHLATGFGGLHLMFPYEREVEMVERYAAEVLPHLDG
jgi:probable F420-dependent oxidoreductase